MLDAAIGLIHIPRADNHLHRLHTDVALLGIKARPDMLPAVILIVPAVVTEAVESIIRRAGIVGMIRPRIKRRGVILVRGLHVRDGAVVVLVLAVLLERILAGVTALGDVQDVGSFSIAGKGLDEQVVRADRQRKTLNNGRAGLIRAAIIVAR